MYEFEHEDIILMVNAKRKGILSAQDVVNMENIYRKYINPNKSICHSCSNTLKDNFSRLELIICESLGIKSLLNYTRKDIK